MLLLPRRGMPDPEPSACFACIAFLICVEILSCFAACRTAIAGRARRVAFAVTGRDR
jgi:hypothetical protein